MNKATVGLAEPDYSLSSSFILKTHNSSSRADMQERHEVTWHSWFGGERHVRLPESFYRISKKQLTVEIIARLYSPIGIVDLPLLVDAIRREMGSDVPIILDMPYVPYARQDRVALRGESLAIKVFCDQINSLGFKSVFIEDPHSAVTEALLDNVQVTPAGKYVKELLESQFKGQSVVLIAPDAGARKKVEKIGADLGLPVVFATKHRDPKTTDISHTEIQISDEILEATDVYLIVDDICDGGRTFIDLSKAIDVNYPDAELHLFTTHGLYARGLDTLRKHFAGIYTANCANPDFALETSIVPITS